MIVLSYLKEHVAYAGHDHCPVFLMIDIVLAIWHVGWGFWAKPSS